MHYSIIHFVGRIIESVTRNKKLNKRDFCIQCSPFSKLLKYNQIEIATKLMVEIKTEIYKQEEEIVLSLLFVNVDSLKGYLDIYLKSSYLRNIVDMILDKSNSFLNELQWDKKRCNNTKQVIVQSSQPNTHKALNIGHIRNIAPCDCLVGLYDDCGYSVVAANYFVDEGEHVAKCLWLLDKKINQGELHDDLDVNKLLLNTYINTLLLFKGVIAGEVVNKTISAATRKIIAHASRKRTKKQDLEINHQQTAIEIIIKYSLVFDINKDIASNDNNEILRTFFNCLGLGLFVIVVLRISVYTIIAKKLKYKVVVDLVMNVIHAINVIINLYVNFYLESIEYSIALPIAFNVSLCLLFFYLLFEFHFIFVVFLKTF